MIDKAALKLQKLIFQYRRDPLLYMSQVLGVNLTPMQQEIVTALITYKRVFVKASHSIGKSFIAACLTNWHFDCFAPGLTLTTAPTYQQVVDVLWKEIRTLRKGRPGLLPKASRMEGANANHFAVGYTAIDSTAFQGRHEKNVLVIFDEAVGIDSEFFDAADAILTGDECLWLAICNPTDTASRAYIECTNNDKWHVIDISALDHPNIEAELGGRPAPFPAAVSLGWLQQRVQEWCEAIPAEDKRAADFEFPPDAGIWYRPGPLFESRVLGRWPSQGAISVWSEAKWNATLTEQAINIHEPLSIGCDKARFGDDFTSIVVRRGNCALWHETHNGWDNSQIAGRLKQLCQQFVIGAEQPQTVKCQVDDVQGGVIDQANGYTFLEVNSSRTAFEEAGYPNKRSELWFTTAERADTGRVDVSRLSDASRKLLRSQCMAPTWKVDAQGRRVVEPKSDTKKRIQRSPDDADALNLAFYHAPLLNAAVYGGQRPLVASPVANRLQSPDALPAPGVNRFDPYSGRR